MSSVIPARLQFLCGHAALVTLPRLKGESSAQRNERVAREKSAALARQCDFCGPTVQVAVATPEVVNGNHMLTAELTAPEVETVVVEPVAEEEPIIVVVDEPVVFVEEEPVESITEVIPQPIDAQPEPVHTNGKTHVRPVRPRRAAKIERQVMATQPTTSTKFVVEYRVERLLTAASIRDALRQAEALGAVDVLAATRED